MTETTTPKAPTPVEKIHTTFTPRVVATAHVPIIDQIHEKAKELALFIHTSVPASQELDHAIHYLDLTVHSAKAALERNAK